jgi:hypothetical protein
MQRLWPFICKEAPHLPDLHGLEGMEIAEALHGLDLLRQRDAIYENMDISPLLF